MAKTSFRKPTAIHGRAHLTVTELTTLLLNRLKRPILVEQMTDEERTLITLLDIYAPYRARVELIEPLDQDPRLRLLVMGKERFKAAFSRDNLRTIAGLIRQECK